MTDGEKTGAMLAGLLGMMSLLAFMPDRAAWLYLILAALVGSGTALWHVLRGGS